MSYRLTIIDTIARFALPIDRLDPLIEIAVLAQAGGEQRISAGDVFAVSNRFPFVRTKNGVAPAIPELSPGFVLREDGEIFSRLRLPDGDDGGQRYHYPASVKVEDGRAALATAARLVADGAVENLFIGPRLRPQLDNSVRDVGCIGIRRAITAGAEETTLDGAGVVIGVIDYGCDFAHRNFRHPDGRTRLLCLWDQNEGPGTPPPEASYGREFDAAAIDAALRQKDPYAAGGYDPHDNYFAVGKVRAAHGTHVLDIAAGNGRGTGCPGVAPAADIVFVQLRRYDWTGDPDLNRTAALLDAIAYVFVRAGGRPAVVNLSLGTNGGSHDGTSVIERALDIFLKQPGRAIVVAAGNAGSSQLHAGGTIAAGSFRRLRWRFPPRDKGPNQLEIWSDRPLRIGLTDPSGHVLGDVGAGTTGAIERDGRHVGAVIGGRAVDAGMHVITVALRPNGREAVWTVELANDGDRDCRFDAWIDRDDPGQSHFVPEDSDPDRTLASLACSRDTIVAGAHYALAPNRDLASFTGRGGTRDGRQNPHVTAPGRKVWAAASKKDRGKGVAPRVEMSGTSMATPHVAGTAALLLQANPRARATEIRDAIMRTAKRREGSGWESGYGFGRLDAAAACRIS